MLMIVVQKSKNTYGTATARNIADTLYTEQNKTDGQKYLNNKERC